MLYMATDEFQELGDKKLRESWAIEEDSMALVPALGYEIGPSLGQVRERTILSCSHLKRTGWKLLRQTSQRSSTLYRWRAGSRIDRGPDQTMLLRCRPLVDVASK